MCDADNTQCVWLFWICYYWLFDYWFPSALIVLIWYHQQWWPTNIEEKMMLYNWRIRLLVLLKQWYIKIKQKPCLCLYLFFDIFVFIFMVNSEIMKLSLSLFAIFFFLPFLSHQSNITSSYPSYQQLFISNLPFFIFLQFEKQQKTVHLFFHFIFNDQLI